MNYMIKIVPSINIWNNFPTVWVLWQIKYILLANFIVKVTLKFQGALRILYIGSHEYEIKSIGNNK
jgi:hypothetical protein